MIQIDRLEQFMGGPTARFSGRLHLSISPHGVIFMNTTCYRKLESPPAVNLYFDRTQGVIAIEPVHSFRTQAAFPIKQHGSGWRICAAPFCRHFGIRVDATERFINPEFSSDKKKLLVKLSETVSVEYLRKKRKA